MTILQMKQPATPEQISPALLHEMLRSFAALSRSLKLSHAVKELASTRQTVRRHIAILEETLGAPLFLLQDRQYALSDFGAQALPGALDILARGDAWVGGNWRSIEGLDQIRQQSSGSPVFQQQQQPLTALWDNRSKLLAEALICWSKAHGHLDDPEFAHIRPYIVVYRETPNGWICVEVGEKCFYSKWYGWTSARSSVGRPVGELPGGQGMAQMYSIAFQQVKADQGIRLDQIAHGVPRGPGQVPTTAVFLRLLLGGRFPDGSFVLISIVDRAGKILIEGVDPSILDDMPADVVVDF